jgi:Flp pilus assembly protein TadG
MKRFRSMYRRCRRSRSQAAQVIVLFALLLPVLVGAAGLAVDAALLGRAHARLHAVAGAAARAGAQQISPGWLATTDTFVLAADSARDAAQRVCSANQADAWPELACSIDVSPELVDTSDWDSAAIVAWIEFLLNDRTRRYPGFTVHGAVTVIASQDVRVFFVPLLTRQPEVHVAAREWATPVTGV